MYLLLSPRENLASNNEKIEIKGKVNEESPYSYHRVRKYESLALMIIGNSI